MNLSASCENKSLTIGSHTITGAGLGFRAQHFSEIIHHKPPIPWFEVITENYFHEGGLALYQLAQLREHYPIVLHGVGLSLGSSDPLNQDYLLRLKQLVKRFQPAYVSDHLCWTTLQGQYFHELLPLVYSESAVRHVADRIKQVQDFLGQHILVENVSSYVQFPESQLSEWEFLNAVSEAADCFILLDINNIYVSAFNHGFLAQEYLEKINSHRVKQFHLAGFQDCGSYLLDNHGAVVDPAVWELYRLAVKKLGPLPTVIEWDNNIPDFNILVVEADKAQKILEQ